MELNQSSGDRLLRIAAGLAILSLAFVGPRTLWGLVGMIPLLTGMVGFDPIYRMFDDSTRPRRSW
jgi:hypothetical protein